MILQYADVIIKETNIKKYIATTLNRTNCRPIGDGKMIKNIAVFGIPMKDILLIDVKSPQIQLIIYNFLIVQDSLAHYETQPQNILVIKAFKGDPNDNELEQITPFLIRLVEEEDVRPVSEKYVRFVQTGLLSYETKSLDSPIDFEIKSSKAEDLSKLTSESSWKFNYSQTVGEESTNIPDESEFDENCNENSVLHEVFKREDNSRLFDVIKWKPDSTRLRNSYSEQLEVTTVKRAVGSHPSKLPPLITSFDKSDAKRSYDGSPLSTVRLDQGDLPNSPHLKSNSALLKPRTPKLSTLSQYK